MRQIKLLLLAVCLLAAGSVIAAKQTKHTMGSPSRYTRVRCTMRVFRLHTGVIA